MTPEAFNRDMRPYMLIVAYRYTKNRDEAEDLVQHVSIKWLRHRGAITGSLKGWLSESIKNRCIDIRIQNRRVMYSLDAPAETHLGEENSNTPTVELFNDNFYLLADLERLMSELPPLIRQAYILKAQGFNDHEIVSATGLRSAQFKSMLARFRKLANNRLTIRDALK